MKTEIQLTNSKTLRVWATGKVEVLNLKGEVESASFSPHETIKMKNFWEDYFGIPVEESLE